MLTKLTVLNLYCFIFILSGIGFLQAQQPRLTGISQPFQKCWEIPATFSSNIASDNESQIFIPISSGQIKAIDISKNEIWSTNLGGEIVNRPIFQNKMLYVLLKVKDQKLESSGNNYFISAINTDSGITEWKKEFISKKIPIVLLQNNNLLIILTELNPDIFELNSRFLTLDASSGEAIIERVYSFDIKRLFNYSDKSFALLTSKNLVKSVSISDGEVDTFNTSLKIIESGSVYGNGILLSDDRGNVYFTDSSGKEDKFKIRFGAKVTDISLYNNSYLISSLDNFIYAVSIDGKQVNWKKRLAGRIVEKPIVEQNTVIVFSQGDNILYFINFDDGKVFNRITVSDNEEITDSPVLLGNFIFITTNRGISAYSSDDCNNFTADGK